jgi:phospholipid transport system substrate-binding protein
MATMVTTFVHAAATAAGEAVVRETIGAMKKLPDTKDPAARRKLLDSIDNSLALALLAEQSLGPQWSKLTPQERANFIALFTESLEKLAFPRAASALAEVQVTYSSDDNDKASAKVVHTTIARADGGKVPIDYRVAKRHSRWQIVDVTMDGESLSKEVSTRIQAAIQQEGYQKLVIELRKRIGQADTQPPF